MDPIVLASTLHDPENQLNALVNTYGPLIHETFRTSWVIVTPSTGRKTIETLKSLQFKTSMGSTNVFDTYRQAFQHALTPTLDLIFYCDLDRLIHWAQTYPDELKTTVHAYPDHDFLHVGRTARAFATHPQTQTMTEDLANQIASKASGFPVTKDIISACWRLTPPLAERLLRLPNENTYGFYCEWPLVAWRHAQKPQYLEVEGLEWETPDRYLNEIQATGYTRWLHDIQTPDEWAKRVGILHDVIQSMSQYLPS
jgi:hypothetical protein